MTTAATHLTAEDLLKLPEDNLRHELIDGELTTMPPTNAEHGVSTFNLAGIFRDYLKGSKIAVGAGAETGFIISRNPDTVLAPDCAIILRDRLPNGAVPKKKLWPLVPDLVVEVLSPGDTHSEVWSKVTKWLDAGTRLVWIVDPDKKTLTVHAPRRQAQTFREQEHATGEDVLPGFDLAISEIFRP